MKKTLAFLALVVFAALSCSFLVKVGQAGVISVGTYNATGLPRDFFSLGVNVRIIADSTDMPITINVTDPDGIVVHTEIYYGYVYDKKLSGLTEKLGKYTVEASSPWDEEQKNYARTYFYVVSEPVGGKAAPINIPIIKSINKPELQTPYIGLTTLLAVAVVTVGYIKKRKREFK